MMMKNIRDLIAESHTNKNAAFISVLSTKLGQAVQKKVKRAKSKMEKKKTEKDLEMEKLLHNNFSQQNIERIKKHNYEKFKKSFIDKE